MTQFRAHEQTLSEVRGTAEKAKDAAAAGARDATDEVAQLAGSAAEPARDAAAAGAVKPLARGWIHLVTAPLALFGGILLAVLAPTEYRLAVAVFAASSALLFTVSAVYHRGTWSPRTHAVLRRIDHSNVFLLIAGTYTPLSVIYLSPGTARLVLWVVWGGAAVGIALRVFWLGAPRWLYVPLYVALGWVAVWFLPDFWAVGGPLIVWLLLGGGIAYTLGAATYGLKWPNPSPRLFGFHEIFHVGTVIGWTCHFVAVLIAVLAA